MPRRTRTENSRVRVRVVAAVAAGIVLTCGLALQLLERNVAIDLAGSVLYTALVGCLVLLLAPRLPGWAVAAIAFGWSALVEVFQLTDLHTAIVASVPGAGLVFGNVFDPVDLAGYLAGALLAWGVAALAQLMPVRRGHGDETSSTIVSPE